MNRCLAPLPDQRYQTAHELLEDLDCHVRDLPMRYAPNTSLTERLKKWWRRHPRATSMASLSTVAGMFIICLGALLGVRSQQLARYSALQTFGVFQNVAREASSQLSLLGSDVEIRREGIDVAQQALKLWNAGRDDWEAQHPFVDLPESERVAVRESIREILYLLASDQARMTQQTQGEESSKHVELALQFNQRGQLLSQHDPMQRSVVFDLQKQDLHTLGLPDGSEETTNGRDDNDTAVQSVLPKEWLDRYLLSVRLVGQEKYEQAIPLAEALSQERPKDVDTWLLLGHAYASRGQLHDAELCYTRCIALWPQVNAPYQIYFFRGIARLQAKNADGAEDDFSEVLRQRPNHLHSHVNRALSRYEQKHVVEAVADLTQAIDKAEGDEDGRWLLLRARCWRQLGKLDRAEEDRERGLSLRPTDEEGWISRGLARLPEDPAGARRDLEEARKLYPHSRRLLQNLAHLLADELRDAEAALAVLDHMLKLDPQNATALAGRGVLQARRGVHEPAIRDAKLAIQASRTPAVSYQVACIYAQLSRTDHGEIDETVLASYRRNAVAFLAETLRQDNSWLRLVPRDPDLEPMREDPEFQEVLRAAAVLQRPVADLTAS
ncbi:MAG: tetratricopeptide repeat protein [Planctomycetota bacterium]|nr:tetratricopeptide repeat protein [Planctomycetota bacterium]